MTTPQTPNQRSSRRYSCLLLALVAAVFVGMLLEALSVLVLPFIPTYHEMMTSFGPAFPRVRSDYLASTTPKNVTLASPAYGVITLNALGYRGPAPTSMIKAPGTKRLMFLGDSFTVGWSVKEEEAFPERIRERLRDHNPPIEVINAAWHGGYSPDSYYAYLRREGIEIAPDMVVIVLFAGNDLIDIADNVWTSTDESGAPRTLYTIRAFPDYEGKLFNPDLLPWNYRLPVLQNERYFLAFTTGINALVFPQSAFWAGRIGRPSSDEDAYRRFEIVTRATAKFCDDQRIPLVYVMIHSLSNTTESESAYRDAMEKLVRDELKLPYVPVYTELKSEHEIPNDGHLTPEGQRVLADAVWREIEPRLPQ